MLLTLFTISYLKNDLKPTFCTFFLTKNFFNILILFSFFYPFLPLCLYPTKRLNMKAKIDYVLDFENRKWTECNCGELNRDNNKQNYCPATMDGRPSEMMKKCTCCRTCYGKCIIKQSDDIDKRNEINERINSSNFKNEHKLLHEGAK